MTELDPAVYDVLVDELRREDERAAKLAAGAPAAADEDEDLFGPPDE